MYNHGILQGNTLESHPIVINHKNNYLTVFFFQRLKIEFAENCSKTAEVVALLLQCLENKEKMEDVCYYGL